jgi:ABC-type phosphate transport system permease subunit
MLGEMTMDELVNATNKIVVIALLISITIAIINGVYLKNFTEERGPKDILFTADECVELGAEVVRENRRDGGG